MTLLSVSHEVHARRIKFVRSKGGCHRAFHGSPYSVGRKVELPPRGCRQCALEARARDP